VIRSPGNITRYNSRFFRHGDNELRVLSNAIEFVWRCANSCWVAVTAQPQGSNMQAPTQPTEMTHRSIANPTGVSRLLSLAALLAGLSGCAIIPGQKPTACASNRP